MKGLDWVPDPETWNPIVNSGHMIRIFGCGFDLKRIFALLLTDREFVEWMVMVPEASEQGREVTPTQIRSLETMWKTDPDGDLEGLEDPDRTLQELHVQRVKMIYEDEVEYQYVFKPLVEHEAETQKILKESTTYEGVQVRIDIQHIGEPLFFAH